MAISIGRFLLRPANGLLCGCIYKRFIVYRGMAHIYFRTTKWRGEEGGGARRGGEEREEGREVLIYGITSRQVTKDFGVCMLQDENEI